MKEYSQLKSDHLLLYVLLKLGINGFLVHLCFSVDHTRAGATQREILIKAESRQSCREHVTESASFLRRSSSKFGQSAASTKAFNNVHPVKCNEPEHLSMQNNSRGLGFIRHPYYESSRPTPHEELQYYQADKRSLCRHDEYSYPSSPNGAFLAAFLSEHNIYCIYILIDYSSSPSPQLSEHLPRAYTHLDVHQPLLESYSPPQYVQSISNEILYNGAVV